MATRRWSRGLFRRRDARERDDDSVHIGDADAWWAEREAVHAPNPKKRGREAEGATTAPGAGEDDSAAFGAYYSTDSLFEDAPQLDETTPVDDAHFEVLGLEPGSSWEQIWARHRTLALELHPDRLAHLPPDAATEAADRMVEVNVAYDHLARRHRVADRA